METLDIFGDGIDIESRQFIYGCASLWEVIEQIDIATDTTMMTHVYGLGIDDEVSYQYEEQSVPKDIWTHRDDLNSLTSITDSNGDVQERYEYGDYGKVAFFDEAGVSLPSSSFNAQHLYTGRTMIAGTGLYDYRHRVMDPEIGVFIQRDPLGYMDSMNVYVYVSTSPHSLVDPYGLFGFDPFGGVGWVEDNSWRVSMGVIGVALNVTRTTNDVSRATNNVKNFHYNRNSFQPPRTHNEVTAPGSGWTQLSIEESVYHGIYNRKFVKGNEEVVIGVWNQLITNQTDGGTYNFANPRDSGLYHMLLDVLPYYLWGNGPCDKNDFGHRMLMTGISIKIKFS